jgi:hypothetical protein
VDANHRAVEAWRSFHHRRASNDWEETLEVGFRDGSLGRESSAAGVSQQARSQLPRGGALVEAVRQVIAADEQPPAVRRGELEDGAELVVEVLVADDGGLSKESIELINTVIDSFFTTDRDYCTQNNKDCCTCSLANYGRDCANFPLSEVKTYHPADYLNAVYFDSDRCKCGTNVVIEVDFKISGQLYIVDCNTTDSELIALAGIIRGSIVENVILDDLEKWLTDTRNLCLKNFCEQN